MKTFSIIAMFFAVALFATAAHAQDKPDFDGKVEGTVSVGKESKFSYVISVQKDSKGNEYKWNEQYPAKFTVKKGPAKLALKKTPDAKGQVVLRKTENDIVADGKKGKVIVVATGKIAGEDTIEGEIKFSACSPQACVLIKRDVTIKVAVK